MLQVCSFVRWFVLLGCFCELVGPLSGERSVRPNEPCHMEVGVSLKLFFLQTPTKTAVVEAFLESLPFDGHYQPCTSKRKKATAMNMFSSVCLHATYRPPEGPAE